MTNSQQRLEISTRLEKAVARITGPPENAGETYERLEMTAISILDSEHENYPEGVLAAHLQAILSAKRRGLGLEPF